MGPADGGEAGRRTQISQISRQMATPRTTKLINWCQQLNAFPIGVSNSTHSQLTSATPRTIDITPRAKTCRKTTGTLTARRHLYLDD
uniref:Uncharacterized protein n=1 Tax=Romanomermis culicivorax TaxID=13658 RepID=A0A915JJX9_ROMCU